MNLKLRDYQNDLYLKARAQFTSGKRRALVVAPCGAGKTAIAAAMMQATLENNPKGECLMLVHRRELLNQHIDTMTGYGVDTSRIRIESVFTEAKRLGKHKKPLLLVLDEAHLSKAASWERVVQFYDTWTTGFSATPCRLDGRPLGDIFDSMVQGITHKELEAQGRLAPFDYYAPADIDLSGVKKQCGDYNQGEIEDLVCRKTIYGDVIKSYRRFADGRMTIAFCVSVRHSREVADEFNAAGVKAASLDGSMTKSVRADIMKQFRNGTIKVLTTCGLLAEGIDIPEISCVMMLRPSDSLALVVQQQCRCLRADRNNPNKRAVILDMVGNYTRHGMPDSNREWSLDSNVKSIRTSNADGSLSLRVCSYCFKTFENKGNVDVCPYCSAPYELKPTEIRAMRDIELARIDKEQFEAEQARKAEAAQAIRNARCFEDLLRIEKKYGYKRGWAMIRARLRGYR